MTANLFFFMQGDASFPWSLKNQTLCYITTDKGICLRATFDRGRVEKKERDTCIVDLSET